MVSNTRKWRKNESLVQADSGNMSVYDYLKKNQINGRELTKNELRSKHLPAGSIHDSIALMDPGSKICWLR